MNKVGLFLITFIGALCLLGTVSAQTNTVQVQPVQASGWSSDKKEIIVRPIENDTRVIWATISPETIISVDDLEVFAQNIVNQDSNIKLIKLTSGSSEISYQYPGNFLVIIPVKARAIASVGKNYQAKVKFPWYGLFIKRTVDLTLNEKESDLSRFQLPNLHDEIQKQAWSLQLLSNILKNKYDKATSSLKSAKKL